MSLYFTLNTYKTTTIPVFRSVVIIPSADAEGDRCYTVAYKWDRDLLETETVYSLDEAISTAPREVVMKLIQRRFTCQLY